MTSKSFIVSDYYDLLNLHKALMEAKFCDEPNNTYVSASPIVARLHNELLEILINADADKNGIKVRGDWERWKTIDESRREWKIGLERLKYESCWSKFNFDEKVEYTLNLLAPFSVKDEILEKFIEEADKVLSLSD